MCPPVLRGRVHEFKKYVIMELPRGTAIIPTGKNLKNSGGINMAFILKLQDGTIKKYSSANSAVKDFGATSPMNWPSARTFLEKRGIEILEWESEKGKRTPGITGSSEKRMLARLIDDCAKVDKEALKALRARVDEIFPLAYASEDYQQELVELSAKMQDLKNPEVTLPVVIEHVRSLWKKYAEEIFAERAGEVVENGDE